MFTESLDLFLQDFGVPCSSGSVQGVGILDMPTQVISDGMVLSTDYMLTAKAADFGGLLAGAVIVVDGVTYEVRETLLVDDGAFAKLSLTKVSMSDGVFSLGVFVNGVFV